MIDPSLLTAYWDATRPFLQAGSVAIGLTFWKGVQFVYDAWRQKKQDQIDDEARKRVIEEGKQLDLDRQKLEERIQQELDRLTRVNALLEQKNIDLMANALLLYRQVTDLRTQVTAFYAKEGLPLPQFEPIYFQPTIKDTKSEK
jgi:hypothetical protein